MKRYFITALDGKAKGDNLFKDGRTFKNKTYANSVMIKHRRFITNKLAVKEIEVLTDEEKVLKAIEALKKIAYNSIRIESTIASRALKEMGVL